MRRVLIGTLVLFGMVVFAASAAAAHHYTDPASDSGSAPDLISVDVSNDSAGNVTFGIGFSPPTLASDEGLGIYVDSDQNASTGDPSHGGTDYVLFLYQASWDFYRWSGSSFVSASHGPISVSATPSGASATINKADLGGASSFRFWLESQKASSSGSGLEAWDVAGPYTYTPTSVAKVLVTLKPPAAAKGIHPGTSFSIMAASVRLSDGTTASADPVSCTATVGSKSLPSAGTCAWKVPKSAGGKKVVVTVTVSYGGESYGTRLSLRVLKK
jgi:hypothetical protein